MARVRTTVARDQKEENLVLRKKKKGVASFTCLFVLNPLMTWNMTLKLMITVLISSTNTLVDTPKSDVLSAIWACQNPSTLAHEKNNYSI